MTANGATSEHRRGWVTGVDSAPDSLAVNQAHWDERAAPHAASPDYAVARFRADGVPWNALPGQMHEVDDNEWRLTDRPDRLPHSYTLQAVER